jgi:ubiquinone/menaquinone biosynthesis C-methylase UbiE
MMDREEATAKAEATFNAAADYFDNPALSFWSRFGQRTIDLVELQSGQRVLDVCCGSGASAIPAALKVGTTGEVIGVDIAASLLDLARNKARQQGLTNLDFRYEDITKLTFPDGSFDAIVCVFGIFFLPDMEAAIAKLWQMLRPGGKLAITSWGARIFEPANRTFWSAIESERPDLCRQYTPWYRIDNRDALQALLATGGADRVEVIAETDAHTLTTPDDWWTMAMGGGLRGTIDRLDLAVKERVRSVNLEFLQANNIRELDSDVLYAIAQK